MGKLPGFTFYPGDWLKDPELLRCTKAEKGVWIDMLMVMFGCADRGVFATGGVPWTDREIAAAIGGDIAENLTCLRELLRKRVARRNSFGAVFSARMVRDETDRADTKVRVQNHRDKKKCNDTVTGIETPMYEGEDETECRMKEEEVPEGLHPINYATKICEEVGLPLRGNLNMVVSSLEAIMKPNGLSAKGAHIYLLGKAKDSIARGETVDHLWFLNARWNGSGKQRVSPSEQRSDRSKENIIDGLRKNASRRDASVQPEFEIGTGKRLSS